MYPSQLEFLKHILDECIFLTEVTGNKSQADISNDEILRRAVIRSLEIIGEASKKIDYEFATNHPEISWSEMAKMRDRLIHHYFGIDYDVVFSALTKDIPELKCSLEKILAT